MKRTGLQLVAAIMLALAVGFGGVPSASQAASHLDTPESPTQTATFISRGGQDGFITESSQTSETGGAVTYLSGYFRLGDFRGNKQLKVFLSFDTSTLPEDAVIVSARLEFHRLLTIGENPYSWAGNLNVDVAAPFGVSSSLAREDFNAPASAYDVAACSSVPVSDTYSCDLTTGFDAFNLAGATQFRLYFDTPDNGDRGDDYLKLVSGNHKAVEFRPALIVEYYLP